MREKLFGLKRELTLRHGLRRHVNELIPSINFTSSERGEFSPEATVLWLKLRVMMTREAKSGETSARAAVTYSCTNLDGAVAPS